MHHEGAFFPIHLPEKLKKGRLFSIFCEKGPKITREGAFLGLFRAHLKNLFFEMCRSPKNGLEGAFLRPFSKKMACFGLRGARRPKKNAPSRPFFGSTNERFLVGLRGPPKNGLEGAFFGGDFSPRQRAGARRRKIADPRSGSP